jgi:purine nucleosidase
VDQLIRLAKAHPGEITLVAVGPLTNIAVALARESRLPALLKNLVVMGGAFAHAGNVSSTAEFNVSVDPEAAKAVFEAGFDLTVVPLDATMQVLLDEPQLERLGSGPVPDFVRAITKEYLDYGEGRRGRRVAAMHDPLATAIAMEPALMLEAQHVAVTVETAGHWTRGLTIADRRPGVPRPDSPPGRATVCFRADAERFFAEFFPLVLRAGR